MHASSSVSNGSATVHRTVLPIENDSLGRLIALVLQKQLLVSNHTVPNSGSHDSGWYESLANEMGNMSEDEVAKVLGGPNSCVSLVFDSRRVAAGLNSYRALKRDQSDLEFFLLGGATPALVSKLFSGISSRTVTQTRKRLGCDSRGGRPRLPDAETSHAIYRSWQTLCTQEPSLRMRYMRLKKLFPDLSFATLCAAIEAR